ncbi:hypothetical protein CBL_05641 [Carabus blaptoides fortunei]
MTTVGVSIFVRLQSPNARSKKERISFKRTKSTNLHDNTHGKVNELHLDRSWYSGSLIRALGVIQEDLVIAFTICNHFSVLQICECLENKTKSNIIAYLLKLDANFLSQCFAKLIDNKALFQAARAGRASSYNTNTQSSPTNHGRRTTESRDTRPYANASHRL